MGDILPPSQASPENAYGKVGVQVANAAAINPVAQEKFQNFLPRATELLNNADTVISSLDLDGVVFDEYINGEPIINKQELETIPMHMRRINKALAQNGKKAYLWLNTNRELPIVKPIMEVLDPENTQGHMAAVLEGGHVLGYQISKKHLQSADVNEATGLVRFTDGGIAHIVNESNNGQILLSESLLEAPHLRDIRLGSNNLTVSQARAALNEAFETKASELGKKAWIPAGRKGMVTVRGVDQAQVVGKAGQDISTIKKWHIPENAPIMNIVRDTLSLDETVNFKDLPFELIYYPFDGGFDVQFKGLNKTFGQKALVARMKSLGIIPADDQVVILHKGDSGSDGIEFEDEKLKTSCVVLAVANSDQGLIGKSSLLATYPHRRGVRQALYGLGSLAKTLRSAQAE